MNWAADPGWNSFMCRLLVHVEGETEETFVNEILARHLCEHGYSKVSARLLGNARQRDRRGGIRGWNSVRKDIINHLKYDRDCTATTMIDYYGLPQTGDKAWPGRARASELPFEQKAVTVQDALHRDICQEMGEEFRKNRFIPFVTMHEFEGLLFSDCELFAEGIGRIELKTQFQEIRNAFSSPEEINDSVETAPSKRVASLVPGYEKPLLGALAVLSIGLGPILKACPHFSNWLFRLENRKSIFE
jgi:hypothetical protein